MSDSPHQQIILFRHFPLSEFQVINTFRSLALLGVLGGRQCNNKLPDDEGIAKLYYVDIKYIFQKILCSTQYRLP
jgi:hypothetical protein